MKAIATKFVKWDIQPLENLQGLQPPSETEQQWQVEPRRKGLDNQASEPQYLFPQCYTLVRLAV